MRRYLVGLASLLLVAASLFGVSSRGSGAARVTGSGGPGRSMWV